MSLCEIRAEIRFPNFQSLLLLADHLGEHPPLLPFRQYEGDSFKGLPEISCAYLAFTMSLDFFCLLSDPSSLAVWNGLEDRNG